MELNQQFVTELNASNISNSSVIEVLHENYNASSLKDGNILDNEGKVVANLEQLMSSGIIDDKITKEQFTNAFGELYSNWNTDNDGEGDGDGSGSGDGDGNGDGADNGVTAGESIIFTNEEGVDINATIDDAGNAVDKDGNIVLTAEEVLAQINDEGDGNGDGDGEGDEDIISAVATLDGFEAVGEDGKPLEFDNSYEGLAKRNAYIVQQQAQNAVSSTFDKFFNENPDLEDMWQYKNRNNGSLEGYNRDVTLLQTEIKDDTDETTLSNIVREAEIARGRTPKDADSFIEYLKAEEKLKDEATVAQGFLKANKEQEDLAFEQQEQLLEQQRANDINKHWSSVKTIVDSGELKGLGVGIPETLKIKGADGVIRNITREDIFNYSSKAVTPEGYSQAQLDRANSEHGLEYKVLIDLLQLVGGDLSQLIKEGISNDNVRKLKSRKAAFVKGQRRFTKPTPRNNADNVNV